MLSRLQSKDYYTQRYNPQNQYFSPYIPCVKKNRTRCIPKGAVFMFLYQNLFYVTLASIRFLPITASIKTYTIVAFRYFYPRSARSFANSAPLALENCSRSISTVSFCFSSPLTSKMMRPAFIIISLLPWAMASFML